MQKPIAFLAICSILIYTPLKSDAGEQLRQDFPLPTGEWEVFRTKDGHISRWFDSKTNDGYSTDIIPFENVYTHTGITPISSKTIHDKINKEYCAISESLIISEKSTNGFPTILWESTCKTKSGANTVTLSKVIIGIEASYSFSKTWMSKPSKEAYEIWLKYITNIFACNPEALYHSCPT